MRAAIRFAAILFFAFACVPRAFAADDAEIRRVVMDCLHAFEDLDLDRFTSCFAPDATMFFPSPEPPERFDGRDAIRARFASVFAGIRAHSDAKAPPYHHLAPEDLRIDRLGPDVAIATFHLRNAERIARRTFVLERRDGTWRIRHLHASNEPRTEATSSSAAKAPPTKP